MKAVEFLLYTLKPGTGKEFHRIMTEESAPLHRSAGMDSEAWRLGPRQAIIDRISLSVKSVLTLSDSAIENLRSS
ncbi:MULTISPECIES: hypothetical protein [unclassified Kosakonia]|uniref:hypothetical protein n=1 Tax=unclassified Kosakonia TaxID=2632876 RepID=UPI0031B70C9B